MKYIIGIDIGTSGTKAVAVAVDGTILATAQKSYEAITPHPGYHELDPAVLLDAVQKTLREIIAYSGKMPGLSGISFSCAMHSLVAVDQEGKPLTNAITWADTRSKAIAAELKNSEAGNRIYAHSGTPVHPMSPLCKIAWLKAHAPELFAKAKKFIGIKEYIWFLFFGKYQVDYSIASATGMFDNERLQWYSEALDFAGISEEQLSMPVASTHIETTLAEAFKDALGLTTDIPFVIGASDGCLANLGSGAVHAGDASLTIGTSGALRMMSSKPRPDAGQRIFNYILTEDRYVSGGAVNNGGIVAKWFIDHFNTGDAAGSTDISAGLNEIASIGPGAAGLIFLPYLLGERAPVWDADARGVFFGIGPEHGRSHFMRALIEGISFSLYQVGLTLEETNGRINNIYASGGFIHASEWLRIIADIFNKPLMVTNTADASAVGAAFLAMPACGLLEGLHETKKLVTVKTVVEPNTDNHRVYQENYSIFSSLYGNLKGAFGDLARLREGRS